MRNFKKITGVTFLIIGILGVLMCLSYTFDLDLFDRDNDYFGRGFDGDSASNSPAFFGLIAIAGALLLSQVKPIKVKDTDESIKQ